jgi:hypothetical protein
MHTPNKVVDENGHALMKDFGAFYPTGHTVVAFNHASDARKVLQSLVDLGDAFADSFFLSAAQMVQLAEHNLTEVGVIASMGTSVTTVQAFLDVARQGASFLILATPDDQTMQQVMDAIHRVPFMLAQRHHALAIEEVKKT